MSAAGDCDGRAGGFLRPVLCTRWRRVPVPAVPPPLMPAAHLLAALPCPPSLPPCTFSTHPAPAAPLAPGLAAARAVCGRQPRARAQRQGRRRRVRLPGRLHRCAACVSCGCILFQQQQQQQQQQEVLEAAPAAEPYTCLVFLLKYLPAVLPPLLLRILSHLFHPLLLCPSCPQACSPTPACALSWRQWRTTLPPGQTASARPARSATL